MSIHKETEADNKMGECTKLLKRLEHFSEGYIFYSEKGPIKPVQNASDSP